MNSNASPRPHLPVPRARGFGALRVLLAVVSAALWFLPAASRPVWAGPFDVILADSADVTLCQGCGITLAGLDYGLIVNTGTSDITIADLHGATFTVAASRADIALYPFINIPNEQIVGAIHPGEAMGSIISENQLLLPLLQPGETLRNLAGMQFMAYQVGRGSGLYQGPIRFDVTMAMAGYVTRFTIGAEVHVGPHAISFLRATRVSAVPGDAPPVCSGASATPSTLSPPNGRMVPIEVAGVTDPEGDPVTLSVTGITQDEPVDTNGGPRTPRSCPDAQIVDGKALVRAQRSGGGNGRVYEIRFVAMDGQGGQCDGSVKVCVPATPGGACVDDGQQYNSLQDCSPDSVAVQHFLSLGTIATGREPMVEYSLTGAADIAVEMFDVSGRRVALLDKGARPAGQHVVRWTPGLTPGVYLLCVRAGQHMVSRKVILTRN